MGGITLAYASARKDGVLLDFTTALVKAAPAKLKKGLEDKGGRQLLRVNAKNEAKACELLEWLAKQ